MKIYATKYIGLLVTQIKEKQQEQQNLPYQNKDCVPWKTLWKSEAENPGLSRPFDCNHQYLGYVYLSPFVCLVTFLINAGDYITNRKIT